MNDWGNDNDVEATLGTELAEEGGVAGLFVTEAKIFTDEDGTDLQVAEEDLIDKFPRRTTGEFVGEGKDDDGFDMEVCKNAEALVLGGKAEGSGFGAEDLLRWGIESEDGRDGVDVAGPGSGGAKNGLVTEMDAVKIANGDGAAAGGSRKMGGPPLGGKEGGKGRACGARGGSDVSRGGKMRFVHLDLKREPVVGGMNPGEAEVAEALDGFGVGEVVGDVREPSAPGIEFRDKRESLIHSLVHGVGHVAEGIEDKFVEIGEEWERRIGDGTEVGDVGGAGEAEAENFHVAVNERNGRYLDAEKIERSGGLAKGNARD